MNKYLIGTQLPTEAATMYALHKPARSTLNVTILQRLHSQPADLCPPQPFIRPLTTSGMCLAPNSNDSYRLDCIDVERSLS